jgi:hypothetical protein
MVAYKGNPTGFQRVGKTEHSAEDEAVFGKYSVVELNEGSIPFTCSKPSLRAGSLAIMVPKNGKNENKLRIAP